MKVIICAGPPTSGKTTVLKQTIRKLIAKGQSVSFLKIDVQYADEDELFAKEFGIPTRKIYSGELCPDHCNVVVMGDAIRWAMENKSDILVVEDRRALPALLALHRTLAGAHRAGGHQRHEPAAQNRPDAVAGRRRRGHQDRPGVPGRARGLPRQHPRRRLRRHHHRVRRPPRRKHRLCRPPDRALRAHAAAHLPARQPAGRHLHHLRRQEGHRLGKAISASSVPWKTNCSIKGNKQT